MDMAIEFLRFMENRDTKPNTIIYNTIIDGLCKDKMVDQALILLSEMIEKCIAPNVVTYSCCHFFFTQMRDRKIVPDVITFSIMVDALCKEGEIEHAKDLIRSMIQQGQHPNTVTYHALMDGLLLAGKDR